MNASEPSTKHRKKLDDIKTKGYNLSWEKCEGNQFTVRTVSGVQKASTQPGLSLRNLGSCKAMLRENAQSEEDSSGGNIDALCSGGPRRSSDEAE
jgi:hypothetical protein